MIDLIPSLTIIGSNTALTYLSDIVNEPFNHKSSEEIGVLKVGDKTFEFISVPFLHWPDSMFTYLRENKILFTCDSFGSHYSPKGSILMSKLPKEEEGRYQEALSYYYNAIFSPFKNYVLKGYEKIKNHDIDTICCGHGPVIDTNVWDVINVYVEWSHPPSHGEHKKVVIVYSSAYGYTKEIGSRIASGIKLSCPCIDLKIYEVDIQNYEKLKPEIMNEILVADGVLLGTNTINGDAVLPIWNIALSLSPYVHNEKLYSAFGSYGWSGEGVDNIISRMNQLRGSVLDGFKVKFRMSKKEREDAESFGKLYGKCLLTGDVPLKPKSNIAGNKKWQELNPTGKVVLWRCIICGEIYAGIAPPLTCPACGVGQELFELIPKKMYVSHQMNHLSM
jgi:flavorubredoxin/rubredoxin